MICRNLYNKSKIKSVISIHDKLAYYIQNPLDIQPHVRKSSLSFLNMEAEPALVGKRDILHHKHPFIENATPELLTSATKDSS